MTVSKIRFAAFGLCTGALALSLSGCAAGAHQIVESEGECVSCHSDSHEFYDVDASSKATSVSASVEVTADAEEIAVCKPLFTSEDGSYYVPLMQRTFSVEGGIAKVELEPGTWVLAIDKGESAVSKLVTVSGDGATSIELK